MDGNRFDGLARSLAARPSRRAVVGALAGGAITVLGRRGAAAKPRPANCKAFCDSAGLTGQAKGRCYNDCAQGGALFTQCDGNAAGVCATAAELSCPDFSSDPAHCGACNNRCTEANPTCYQGQCLCVAGQPDVPACDNIAINTLYCPEGEGRVCRTCFGYATDEDNCTGGNLVCCIPGVDPDCPDHPLVNADNQGVCCRITDVDGNCVER